MMMSDHDDSSEGHGENETANEPQHHKMAIDSPILVELVSYGRRNGKPAHMDHCWNCTSIPNPSGTSRKGRTGLDKRLRTEVLRADRAQQLVEDVVWDLQGRLLQNTDRSMVRIGFGCEMGKHRSVSIAISVAEMLLRENHGRQLAISVIHRDIESGNGKQKSRTKNHKK